MHKLASSFVLGYHGCDEVVAEILLSGDDFKASQNDYDWLGPGIYFWEANPQRGLDFARELKSRGPGNVETPAVIGAVIDLGLCLDLTTSAAIQQVRAAHRELPGVFEKAGTALPKNSADLLRRHLDCAVIQVLHDIRANAKEPALDTVRGVFVEGGPIFPNSGLHEKTHIQIAVCNPECIKGVFRVQDRFLA